MSATPDPRTGGGRDAHGEGGFALVSSMLGVVMVSAVVLVMVAAAVGEVRGSTDHRDHESSLHAAEAAVDLVANRVTASSSYTTGHTWALGASPTPAQEREWARGIYATAVATSPRPASVIRVPSPTCPTSGSCPESLAVGIRPTVGGQPANVLFGVAASPGTPAAQARVVKVQITNGTYTPGHAILTEADLRLNGNPSVLGSNGSVHTNGNLFVEGNPSATGNVTASGVYTGQDKMSAGGVEQGGVPKVTIPVFIARDFYARRLSNLHTVPSNPWHDLCPNGQARYPAPAGGAPCTGPVRPVPSGWKWSSPKWEAEKEDAAGGIMYVFEANAQVPANVGSKTPGGLPVSIIAEARLSDCNPGGDGSKSGNVYINGTPDLVPFFGDGVAIIADRDLEYSGNGKVGLPGRPAFIGVVEQFKVNGNPTIHGALVARDVARRSSGVGDPRTCLGSPVNVGDINNVSGNPSVINDGNLNVQLAGMTRIAAWNEL